MDTTSPLAETVEVSENNILAGCTTGQNRKDLDATTSDLSGGNSDIRTGNK
jgi:hypothetical protein